MTRVLRLGNRIRFRPVVDPRRNLLLAGGPAGFRRPINMGVRTMVSTPYGLFLGSANPFFGLNVYKGANTTPDVLATAGVLSGSANAVQPNPPQHVQVEGAPGGVLLSWDAPSGGAQQYHVFRRSYDPIDVNIAGVGDSSAGYSASNRWDEIGVTDKLTFADSAASLLGRYAYQIKSDNGQGALSEYSNFVIFPSAAAAMKFSDVWRSAEQTCGGWQVCRSGHARSVLRAGGAGRSGCRQR